MNEEQKAALTVREQENIEALRLMLGLSMRKFIVGQDALGELVTALADARLEVARLKALREKLVTGNQRIVQRNLDLEAEVARIQASSEAWMAEARRLEAEVAHYESCYVGNRDGCEHLKRLTVETGVGAEECVGCEYDKLEAEVARLTEERAEALSKLEHWELGSRDEDCPYLTERDRQRADIRRLVEALGDEHKASGCLDDLGPVCATSLILAEMKARYA